MPQKNRGTSGDGGGLILTAEGGIRACLANAIMILSGSPIPEHSALASFNPWEGVVAFDEFGNRPFKRRAPPWLQLCVQSFDPGPWEPQDDLYAAEWLQRNGCMVTPKIAAQAVQAVAQRRPFHPVRDYLDSLQWDFTERLDYWLSDHMGAEKSEYTASVGAKWLISAVARVSEPGCKADTVLILEGPQGAFKSTAIRTLFDPWFADELAEIGSKDAAIQLSGVWCIEAAELDSLARPEVAKIKAFLARRADRFRPPYGERTVEIPRQCVFAGTTNQTGDYLRDETGGRRFWPVPIGHIDLEGLQIHRDQLWAEARVRYLNNETWWIDAETLEKEARRRADDRYETDAWSELIAYHCRSHEHVTVEEIFRDVLDIKPDRWDRRGQMRIVSCLISMGWERVKKQRPDGTRYKAYVRPSVPTVPTSVPTSGSSK